MKRVLAVVILSLVVVQLCLLPIATEGTLGASVVTLPSTNITGSTATLNGSVEIPTGGCIGTTMPDGVLLASLGISVENCIRASVSFKYGTVPGTYNYETTPSPMLVSGAFTANISGLAPCTTYYVRTKVQTIILSNNTYNEYGNSIKGAGVGLDYNNLQKILNNQITPYYPETYGNEISFQTTGCQTFIGTGSHGSSIGGATGTVSTTYGFNPPVTNPVIQTQSASLSSKTVTPGTPVTVTADITNTSSVNGSKKVTLYVNGQVESTQGITVNSGGSTKLTFNVSRSEPGDYSVYVDGVPAGSFKVELFRESDGILIFSAALVALAFIAGMVMLWRRQRTGVN